MVRDVRYITLTSSYRELQEMLLTSQLKTLALVESRGEEAARKWASGHESIRWSLMDPSFAATPPPDSMILLGSIERLQLQSLLSLQLSVQRRLEQLQQLAHNNGTQDHLPSLTSDSSPSSPAACTHINSPASANARQAVRFLVSSQQVGGIWGGSSGLGWGAVCLAVGWEE